MKKITMATFKSILKNKDCELKVKSSFDGMTDCVQSFDSEYIKIDKSKLDLSIQHTFGISGIWCVGNSRDYFTAKSENEIEVYNCCGSFNIRYS